MVFVMFAPSHSMRYSDMLYEYRRGTRTQRKGVVRLTVSAAAEMFGCVSSSNRRPKSRRYLASVTHGRRPMSIAVAFDAFGPRFRGGTAPQQWTISRCCNPQQYWPPTSTSVPLRKAEPPHESDESATPRSTR